MPLIFYFYVILPNLIFCLLLWLTRGAKGFVSYTLGSMIIAWVFFFWVSVMWAMGMVEQDYRALLYGLCLISGIIGMLIGTFLRDSRWRKRHSDKN